MSRKSNNIFVRQINNVRFEISVIGKYGQGESIIGMMLIERQIVFSMIIDSIEEDLTKIEEILKKYKEQNQFNKFNLICWTHPHNDHSKGIKKIIEQYSDEKTNLIVPGQLDSILQYSQHLSKKSKETIKDIEESFVEDYELPLNDRNKELIENIANDTKRNKIFTGNFEAVLNQNPLPSINISNITNTKKVKILMETISPISNIIEYDKRNLKMNLNDFSICLVMNVNNSIFIFSSDIENNTINEMKRIYEEYSNVRFIKIPHHGGKSAENFLEMIDNKALTQNISVSTIYSSGQKKLPNKEILEKYKNSNFEVYCTNQRRFQKCNNNRYGIARFIYKITPLDSDETEIVETGIEEIEVEMIEDAFKYEDDNNTIFHSA